MVQLTKVQARQFLLLKQGLLGEHCFIGKDGVLSYVRQAGCIQFDPVDVCGKNAELTLQSRVRGCTKSLLADLLYQDRLLLDYPDKQLSIIVREDLPYFARYRQAARSGAAEFPELPELETIAKAYIQEHGPVSSDDLPIKGKIFWHSSIHWSGDWHGKSDAARSVLEQLYSTGELIIHHKKGTRKYYDLAEFYLPQELLTASDPLPEEYAHLKWRILRRIGAIGLLWNRPSDAWLNLWNLTQEIRNRAFADLEAEGAILSVQVEGIRGALYYRAEDRPLMDRVLAGEHFRPRCEFLAPLDPLMWDRKLIRSIFDFEYSWEIYTPPKKRKYGYYVLPVILGDRFVGRIEAAADHKSNLLTVRHFWPETDIRLTKAHLAKLDSAIRRLAKFNGCTEILREDQQQLL